MAHLAWLMAQENPGATHTIVLTKRDGPHGRLFGLDIDKDSVVTRVIDGYDASTVGVRPGDRILSSSLELRRCALSRATDARRLHLIIQRNELPVPRISARPAVHLQPAF